MKTKSFLRYSLFFSIFWALCLVSCAKDEPAKVLTPQEQTAANLTAHTWVLEGIFFTGTDVTDLRPDLAMRNTTLKFNKDNTYTTQPSSIIFKTRENWLLANKDNLRINIFTQEEYTLFITTLTDTKLHFEVQIFDDPLQPRGEDYSIRFKKK
jgi:hypothetical protein